MIITEQKLLEEIVDSLKGYERIFLIGCGDCATICNTGGEKQLVAAKELLEQKGKTVVGMTVPEVGCNAASVKRALAKERLALEACDCILVYSCGLGVQSAKLNLRKPKAVLPACDTTFAGLTDAAGAFHEWCALCSSCVLAETEAICPVTRCPKGLMNGPCGGMDKGKCEVDKERDCVWVLIYEAQKEQNRLDVFERIKGPKDHSKTVRPHSKTL